MLKYILAALAAFVLLTATLIPDDAYARRGGGGGFHLILPPGGTLTVRHGPCTNPFRYRGELLQCAFGRGRA